MKDITLKLLFFLLLFFVSQSAALAAPGGVFGGAGGSLNSLKLQVDNNTIAISENALAISELQTITSDLRFDLDALTEEVQLIEGRVSVNESNIAILQTQFLSLNSDMQSAFNQIDTLFADLAVLQQDTEANAAAIADLNAELKATIMTFNEYYITLESFLTQLAAELEVEKADLLNFKAEILAKDAQVSEQISNLQAAIDDLKADVLSKDTITTEQLAAANFTITLLQDEIAGLKTSINTSKSEFNSLLDSYNNHVHTYTYWQGTHEEVRSEIRYNYINYCVNAITGNRRQGNCSIWDLASYNLRVPEPYTYYYTVTLDTWVNGLTALPYTP